MKKNRRLLLSAAVTGMLGVLLEGCASGGSSTFSPAKSCVYVTQDGSVSSALVTQYGEEDLDEKDLRQYLEAAVIRYNKENGGQNTEGGSDKSSPVELTSVSAKSGEMKATFSYATVEDLIKFRQTNDNADESSTISSIEVKKITDADSAGWLADASFLSGDGSKAAPEEVKKDGAAFAVVIEGGGTVMFPGKILFMTEGAVKEDEYTVTVPENGISCVVFK